MIKYHFILLLVVTNQQQCQWIDDNQNKYDYSYLDQSNAWHIPDTQNGMGMFNMVYIFNFCNINLNCHNIPVAVYEGLEVMGTITDNCDIVGLQNTRKITHIEDKPDEYGISISFNDNSQCIETVNQNRPVQTDKPRTAIFNIICSEIKEKQFRITQGYGCTVIFEIYHPVGCPVNQGLLTLSSIKYSFILLIILHLIVFLYNKYIRKIQGIQAMPFIDKWKEFKKLIILGIKFIIKRGNHNGYSLV